MKKNSEIPKFKINIRKQNFLNKYAREIFIIYKW